MTKTRERALELIRQHGEVSAAQFARLFWPNSPGWKAARRHDRIAGAHGAGLIMSAGAFLGRMEADGLLFRGFRERSGLYRPRCLVKGCRYEPGHLGAHKV